MFEITIFDFKKNLKGKIGLSVILIGLVSLIIGLFPSIQESGFSFEEYIQNLPPALAEAFGATIANYSTIEGFLGMEFYSWFWTVALGAYFAYKGGSLISGEIETKRIDLVLSSPLTRSRYFVEKFLSYVPDAFLFNIILGLSVYVGSFLINETISPILLAKVHFLSIPFWLACSAIGGVFSVFIDEERRAKLFATGFIFIAYIIETITVQSDFSFLGKMSFTHYYKPITILSTGEIDLINPLILSMATLVIVFISLIAFEKKDIQT
ncbi:ABC transporter permease [archaeon SCG-AAA382B04]|nr:ABC transporter permease [archaeon SCG-AAA382B04]